MTDQPLIQRALQARIEANELADAKTKQELDQRTRVGIRLVLDRLGIETEASQWSRFGDSRQVQIILDGVVLHTWVDHSGFGSTDVLRTGECNVRSLAHLGQLITTKAAQLNEVPCPTCHGAGVIVEGAVSKADG